jgi:hypothetical protein
MDIRYPPKFGSQSSPIDLRRMQKEMLDIYASYKMTGVENPLEHYRNVENLFGNLISLGHSVYFPHHASDPTNNALITPSEVYELDRTQLERSDLVVAYCVEEASYGIAIEAMFALNAKMPCILLHSSKVRLSRLLLGLPNCFEIVGNDLGEMQEGLHILVDSITKTAAA